MAKIKSIKARQILDSRGNPTIETAIILDNGQTAVTSVPAGASIGKYEALELRDGDQKRFLGRGVLKAVANVNEKIGPKMAGLKVTNQQKVDQALVDLDGTFNKSNLGANAILSVSQATLKAGAKALSLPLYQYLALKYGLVGKKIPMPTSIFNLINGGMHGAGNLDFQEFHIIPSSRGSYQEELRSAQEIYQTLKKVLIYKGAIHSVGDEGGFAPNLFTNLDALEVIVESIGETNYRLGQDVFLGLDVAASFFYQNGQYTIKDRAQPFSTKEMIGYYKNLNKEYHLFSLEDPLFEDDWQGWNSLTREIGEETIIIGDDLLCTNNKRVKKGIEEKACTAILVKPNQIGTISETVEVIKIAKKAGWKIIVSHRSGETNDNFIADFAVGVGAEYTKFGAPARGERVAKYNRLLAIENELKST